MAIDFKSQVDFNKIAAKNFVFDTVTSQTRPANPVGGQVIYEADTGLWKVYNAVKDRWENASGGMTFKGIVGGSTQGALANLPTTDVLIGDTYLVGADGDYGPVGSTQYATKGDKFVATTESTSSVAPTWILFDDNNLLVDSITIVSGTTSYDITNTTGSTNVVVNVFDASGKKIICETIVTVANITISIDATISVAEAGSSYTIVAVNG